MWTEELQFKQACHRKVKTAMLAWAKKTMVVEPVKTCAINSKLIIKKIVANNKKAATIFRYDIDLNDQDRSINEIASLKGGGLVWRLALPLVLTFLAGEDKVPVICHLIDEELGFVSSTQENIAFDFLQSLVIGSDME